tara:strand:- start:674 stop:1342 length:669 start_codon:yes stop_codon:yes gene_type:complete
MGNIATVVHSFDQSGGWTHYNMTGARIHDEVVDFDGTGKTLEQVTSRGTDSFMDDRYDVERIGDDVYQLLFGCGSLYDVGLSLTAAADMDAFNKNPVVSSVNAISALYRRALANSIDIRRLTDSITNRPKANFVEMMGIVRAGIAQDPAAFGFLDESDPALLENADGFFSTATRADANDTVNASFTASDGTKGLYALSSNLTARQLKVQAYVDSLRSRGLRG